MSQSLTVLHAFTAAEDGETPYGGVAIDRGGNLYGVDYTGGPAGNGVIYKIDPLGTFTTLYALTEDEGCNSESPVWLDSRGNLYGTTAYCGSAQNGTVFKLLPSGTLTVLHAFDAGHPFDGGMPVSGVSPGSNGDLYGTTTVGGVQGACCNGTVYKVNHQTGAESVVHGFGPSPDGASPTSSVVFDRSGNLYGTTASGGAYGDLCCGTIFRIDSSGIETILYSFTGDRDGSDPMGGVVRDANGNLYGTTRYGGNSTGGGNGTLFKLDSAAVLTVLHTFGANGDGRQPVSGLTADGHGSFFGTTSFGGKYGNGTVYRSDIKGNVAVLHDFTGGEDGAAPYSKVILDQNGNLYGTATLGGDANCDCGVVFKITPH